MRERALLKIVGGAREGDAVSIELGTCRLIGRHLSESETAMIDRDGNRVLDGAASTIIQTHLKEKAPQTGMATVQAFTEGSFERGPDIIFSDESISRAHAMCFYDEAGVGVIDLASTNGTFVNTERVSSVRMLDGDSLSLGGLDIVVQMLPA